MAAWDNVSLPSAPSTRDYAPPLLDFSPIGNLANTYYRGRQNQFDEQQRQREIALQKPIEATDPNAVAAELMRRGGAPYAAQLVPYLQSIQPGKMSPVFGGDAPTPGASGPQPTSLPAPPATAGASAQPAPLAVPPGGQASGAYAGGDNGTNTVAAIVAGKGLAADDRNTAAVMGNVARAVGADPNAPLTPDQQERASRLIDAYARRQPRAPNGVQVLADGGASGQSTPASAAASAAPLTREALVAAYRNKTPIGAARAVAPDQPPAGFGERFGAGTPEVATAQASAVPAPPPQPAPQAPQPIPGVVLPPGFRPGQESDAVLALRREAARVSGDPNPRTRAQAPELSGWADRIETAMKPHFFAGIMYGPRGEVLNQQAGGPVSGATIDADAERYRQTGQLPPNMGRGIQGQAEARAIRARAVEREAAEGGDPTQWPKRWQEYRAEGIGLSAGARVTATREKNLELILRAADAAIPAAIEQSEKVWRTGIVPLNRIIQKGEVATSDPELRAFGMANLQLAEHWARAMNPTGVMRESDRDKALEFLSTADSIPTYRRLVTQLQTQIYREYKAVKAGKDYQPSAVPVPGGAAPSQHGKESTKSEGWTELPGGIRIREKQ